MIIYFDKSYLKSEEIVFSTDDLHFRYGLGFFETILYNGLNICYLEKHIGRLESSLKDFGFKVYSTDYRRIIKEILNINQLDNKIVKINIYALSENGKNYKILIKTIPYTRQDVEKVNLLISPHKHISYLNRYKTLNYMHFYLAKDFAVKRGYYDALLCDMDNNVLECTTSSIILSDGKNFFTSKESNRLNSISLKIINERFGVNNINIHVDSFEKYQYAFIVNSLIGSLPVEKIGDYNFKINFEINKNFKQLITN